MPRAGQIRGFGGRRSGRSWNHNKGVTILRTAVLSDAEMRGQGIAKEKQA